MDKKALWLRLKSYEFDHLVPPNLWQRVVEAFGGADAATKAFADKLARKLEWSTPFALRAIAEYRKFVSLGMVSDFPVTPSKVIDQVWHEHQLFTQGHRRFCSELLGRHFDHHPELIRADEQLADYQAQYHGTLALYQREFHQEPPPDIWLVPKFQEAKIVRRRAALHLLRIGWWRRSRRIRWRPERRRRRRLVVQRIQLFVGMQQRKLNRFRGSVLGPRLPEAPRPTIDRLATESRPLDMSF